MAEWAEVRRLAADFQRLQESSTVHRLSERNCVELIVTLNKRGLLETLYTLDGKEYVTPSQLECEIRNELIIHGGRINIVDLHQILNVDLAHIEYRVSEMVKHERFFTLIHGEVIERSYMQYLCEEINDIIQEEGQASVADLSKNYNLPINFLMQHIEAALDVQIRGLLDKSDTGIVYTEAYIKRYHARIRGLFHAITQPTSITTIITEGAFQEKLFSAVLHQLVANEELAGDLRGHQDKAVYIPHVYICSQNEWADTFLASNGYLEYDALSRLGVDDPCEFISERYSVECTSGDLVQLSTCCVGKVVMSRVEGALEEMLGSGFWFDAMPLLPSPCTVCDAELLLHQVGNLQPDLLIFGSVSTTNNFLRICCEHFKPAILKKALKAASGRLTDASIPKADDDKTSGNRKRGEGGGGRRKGGKGRRHNQEEDDVKSHTCRFMATDEIAAELTTKYPDCPEDFVLYIVANIESSLQASFIKAVQECLSTAGQNTSASQRRKKHAELQDRLQGLWNMLHLFEKALVHFQDNAVIQLNRYLLRTLCSDLFNFVVLYLADDTGVTQLPESEFTVKERIRVIDALPVSMKKKLTAIDTTLTGKVIAAFVPLFEDLCMQEYCGVILKKPDKKKERQLLFSHQQSLLDDLHNEYEPSMVLHLVAVIRFQQITSCAIHISGKLLPQVLTFLRSHMPSEQYAKLTALEQLIIQQRKLSMQKGVDDVRKSFTTENEDDQAGKMHKGNAEVESSTERGMIDVSDASGQNLQSLLNDLKGIVITPKMTVV